MTESNLLKQLRSIFDKKCQITNKIGRNGCNISLKDAPKSRLIIDLDAEYSPLENKTRCDFLFFADKETEQLVIVLLELKRGELDASKVQKQLKAGAALLQMYIESSSNFDLYALVAVGGTVNKREMNVLRSDKSYINIHNQRRLIKVMKCGSELMTQIK